MVCAVVFVPAADIVPYANQCLEYCISRGYEIAGVIRDDYSAAAEMLLSGAATVLVVARREHLDPGREPRLEVLAEVAAMSQSITARNRRPRLNEDRQALNRPRSRALGDRDV